LPLGGGDVLEESRDDGNALPCLYFKINGWQDWS
jgi:hypothetical protein